MVEDGRYYPALKGLSVRQDRMTPYYEAAWDMRSAVMLDWIEAGETSLVRLLSRFQEHERHYKIYAGTDGDILSGWLRWWDRTNDWPWRGLKKLETSQPAVSRGQDVDLSPYVRFDLSEMLCDFADDVDTIVELGSGYGLQLFKLYHAGAPASARYVGAEISSSGRALAETLAALEPGLRFESRDFDLSRPDWSILDGSRKALIFSSWALMYPHFLPNDFFEGLSRWAGAATLVFCEPLGYQWGVSHPMSENQMAAARGGQLNCNLAALAADATAKGLIEPLLVAKDVFSCSQDDAFDLMSVLVYAKPES